MIDWWRLVPRYFDQNDPTDAEWDKILSAALDRHMPQRRSEYTAQVGPFTVWVGNWPYAYGSLYESRNPTGLPKVATRRRLRRLLDPKAFSAPDRLNPYVEIAKRLIE